MSACGGIGLVNFDDPSAADAFDAQQMSRDFRKAALLDRQRRPAGGARIGQYVCDSLPQCDSGAEGSNEALR
jgi:hypothetical protein